MWPTRLAHVSANFQVLTHWWNLFGVRELLDRILREIEIQLWTHYFEKSRLLMVPNKMSTNNLFEHLYGHLDDSIETKLYINLFVLN